MPSGCVCCKPWRKVRTPLSLMPANLHNLGGLAMARKARKKSAAKAKKKPAAVTKKKRKTKRKTAAKNKSKTAARNKLAARKKPARKAKPKNKPKGVIANIVADFKAVVATLTDAERLHQKLEPRGSPESES